jgi:(1->4)-alpha-D-glucan 1-alpha-D-glucosylmutase
LPFRAGDRTARRVADVEPRGTWGTPHGPLTATYRLQLNADFTLKDTRAHVDYFARLGVSHLYLSPILAARRGSRHGYDVVDPTRINPELGTEADLRALADALHERQMGILLDIVPNHMSTSPENPYWDDVLTYGERSRYARWFDIDWAGDPGGRRKIVLPMLGDELDGALSRGELAVTLAEGRTPRISYFSQSFPLDPASLPPELQLAQTNPEEARELATLYSGRDARHRLAELLRAQHYRLEFWRRGVIEINYRRFFDVNELAALRVQDPAVFAATHAYVLRLVRDELIDGLRVDHIDGLVDPEGYLARLREATPAGTAIFVEKILAPGERLRSSWPVEGTTGYEFLNEVEEVFLDPGGAARIERFYRSLRHLAGGESTFDDIAREAKRRVLRTALLADLERTARIFAEMSRARGHIWTHEQILTALADFIAALPVYRTYVNGGAIDPADRQVIQCAVRVATEASPNDAELVGFIARLLLGEEPEADPDARVRFAQRVQVLSGPAAAKGVEDTALYLYVPVTSRTEVGGEPDRPLRGAIARLHRSNAHRAACWPMSLLATNTHDTKRSADVRARLDSLTELENDWERAVRRWRRLNGKHRRVVNGRMSPDTNTEYLMYQTIVALWPPPRPGRRSDDLPDRKWRESARERLTSYAIKAAREAKTRTSWTQPNSAYEKALEEFVRKILEPGDDAPFLSDVARLVSLAAPIGVANSLSRIAIHLTAPGVPDIYQGDEMWNFALVDPDNRRPVDFDARERALADPGVIEEFGDPFDNRLKALVTRRLLHLRRNHPHLFAAGGYQPLEVVGAKASHIVAFARSDGDQQCVTIASRITASIASADRASWWRDTAIKMPQNTSAEDLVCHIALRRVPTRDGLVHAAHALEKLPVAVFVN